MSRMTPARTARAAVRLREMKRADMPAIMSLERELFPEDAWTPEMFAAEFAQPPSRRLYLVAEDGNALVGYAGMMFTGGSQADVVTLAVTPARWGEGTGTALLHGAGRRGGQARLRGGLARGAGGQPQGQAAVPAPRVRRGRDQARLLPAVRRRRRGHAEGARGDGLPAGAGHRDVLRRDRRRASSAATTCSPTPSPPAWTSTPGSAAWCPRWPAGRTWRRWCRPSTGPCASAGRQPRRRRRHRRHRRARAWPARCWSGWPRPRRTRSRWASRCTASTTWPRTSPSTSWSTARCPSRRWRCWSPAGTPRCCSSPDVAGEVSPLGRDHRRRGRRGVRQGGAGARPAVSRAARRSTGRPATATPPRSASRAG